MSYAFEFIPLHKARSQQKPRLTGKTLISEWGLGIAKVNDLMQNGAMYVDYAKIAAGSPRLYRRDLLAEKLALYTAHNVRPYLGGQFQEYVFATYGEAVLGRFLAEARDIGFVAAEISENYVTLSSEERKQQIRLLKDHGFEVFGEAGSKTGKSSADGLIRHIDEFLAAGAQTVLVEGAEFIEGEIFRHDVLESIRKSVDIDKVMFELPTVRIGASMDRIHDVKKSLIKEIGPDVNIANLAPDDIIETECLRQGLGVIGPSERSGV